MSHTTNDPVDIGIRQAGEDLSSSQFLAVKMNTTTGKWEVCDTLGERAEGILQDDPVLNDAATVRYHGVSEAYYGGTVAIGDELTPAADGQLIARTTETQEVIAVALEAGSADERRTVLVRPRRKGPINYVSFPVTLAAITTSQDVVTGFVPGYAGRIVSIEFIVDVPVTTADDAADLNAEIGTTDVTGGVVALTSATATPMGKRIAGTDITADNEFGASDAISIKASSVTAFAEGTGSVILGLEPIT